MILDDSKFLSIFKYDIRIVKNYFNLEKKAGGEELDLLLFLSSHTISFNFLFNQNLI